MDINDLVVPMILDPLQEERVTVTGRVLNIPESLQTVGVKTDNKVERIYFELPRYFDGFNDFSEFNFYINYVNANGDGDVYYCDDLEIEDDSVVFSWLTDDKLYAKNGTAQFTVRAMHSDGRKWNTTIAQLTILDGLETQEAVVEQDYDFINQQFEIIRQHTEKLNVLIEQVKTNTTNLDKAINTMGQAEWNGNQVRFTDGLGNYGQYHDISGEFISRDEIYLGYSKSQDKVYSGHAGNYGIDVAKIVGAYVQDGTPTPDNPVEPQFNVINEFGTSGKNLFDINGNVNTQGNTGSQVSLNTVENNILTTNVNASNSHYVGQKISSLKGKVISIIAKCISAGTSTTNNITIGIYDNSKLSKAATVTTGDTGKIENYLCQSDNIVIGFGTNNGKGGQITDIMINFGETAQPYTPYVGSSTTPVSLELRALPDGTADVWEDGNITRNVAKVTFDGSEDENWSLNLNYQNVFHIILNGKKCIPICNYYQGYSSISNTTDYGCSYGQHLNIRNKNISTVEELRAELQLNPITIWYALDTPTTEPLAIPTLTSYYPFTNAWCDSELEPKLIEWHVNNKINYLQKLIEEKATF